MKKNLSFRAWLKKTGRKEVSRLLGVTPMTVTYWRQGKVCPRPEQMKKIVTLTKGAVSYDSILRGCL